MSSVEMHNHATRRRSLGLPTERGEDADTVTSKEEEGDTDNSHVLVNTTVPFVDVQRGKKDGEKKEERWKGRRRRRAKMGGRSRGGGPTLRLDWGNPGIGRVDRWSVWGRWRMRWSLARRRARQDSGPVFLDVRD